MPLAPRTVPNPHISNRHVCVTLGTTVVMVKTWELWCEARPCVGANSSLSVRFSVCLEGNVDILTDKLKVTRGQAGHLLLAPHPCAGGCCWIWGRLKSLGRSRAAVGLRTECCCHCFIRGVPAGALSPLLGSEKVTACRDQETWPGLGPG